MALLIDIGELSEQQTDVALNLLYKAVHDHGDDDLIWAKHQSPFISTLIELFTKRGLDRLEAVHKDLLAWVAGEKFKAAKSPPPKPPEPGMMLRWSSGELSLVKLYLESLPPEQFGVDDWMLLIDYLVHRYLPADQLRTEAEWFAVRSALMGQVQANMEALSKGDADLVASALPSTVKAAVSMFDLHGVQKSVMEYGAARCVDNVVSLADGVRHHMKQVILLHAENQMLGDAKPGSSLQTVLFDEFATLNRDWRRIALTEAAENSNQGYIASLAAGSRVKRVEKYAGACAFCRKIDGREMDVVAPDAPEKDGDTQVWPGKSNIGRSASPRKRQGSVLVDRAPSERWWIAAGTQHPHCRGTWVPVPGDVTNEQTEFGKWLKATLESKK